jgi:hypothetical protein
MLEIKRNSYQLLYVLVETHSHTSYQVLTGSYQRKAVDGKTGGWFVIPVRAWHQDCKDLFLLIWSIYVELGRQI